MTDAELGLREDMVDSAITAVNERIKGEGSCTLVDIVGNSYAMIKMESMDIEDFIPILFQDILSEKDVRSILYQRFHQFKNYVLKM